MKSYANASKGLGKLFTGQILSLLSTIILAVSVALLSRNAQLLNDIRTYGAAGREFPTEAAIAEVMFFIGLIIQFISFILMLLGLGKARKDSSGYGSAFIVALAGVIVPILIELIKLIPDLQSFNSVPVTDAVSKLFEVMVVIFVCEETSKLLDSRNLSALAKKGRKTSAIVSITLAVSVAVNVLNTLGNDKVTETVGGIIAIIGAIFSIIGYVFYLSFLMNAKKNLA